MKYRISIIKLLFILCLVSTSWADSNWGTMIWGQDDWYADDTDNDGIYDYYETHVYGTSPSTPDTDGDGLDDGYELSYWGEDWDADLDNDQLINLLDPDSDNDGLTDGIEVYNGSDPGDPNSICCRSLPWMLILME